MDEIPFQDPFRVYSAIRERFENTFLFESMTGPQRLAEYSFIGFDPAGGVRIEDSTIFSDGRRAGFDSVERIRTYLRERGHRPAGGGMRFIGGLVGYISYDLARYLERVNVPGRGERAWMPDLEMGLYLDGLVFDHAKRKAFYFTQSDSRWGEVRSIVRDLDEAPGPGFSAEPVGEDMGQDGFMDAVSRAKERILAGEVFQVVLSRERVFESTGDLLGVYGSLRRVNPSPYMYHIEFGSRRIVGSSPEMLVRVEGSRVTTYPIAGTRPVSSDPGETARLMNDLLSDEKERAEHAMLVDLARNDVGRVARFGSVRVEELMKVERFSHVQHMVSCVSGTLEKGRDALDALVSLFPAGTVSGAPKVRAMDIIADLEGSPRGPYAGVVGYISLNGCMDTAITIRSIVARGSTVRVRAGAGIVQDSVPEREFEETERKLAALQQVMGCAP